MYSKFSGQKVLNHLEHVQRTFGGEHLFPIHINVDLTNYCTHKCIWCSGYEGQQSQANDLDFDILMRAMKTSARLGTKAVTLIGTGDPSLYKRFPELMHGIHDSGIELGMFTHGAFPADYSTDILETFTWVRFSLDAASQETHDHVHAGRGTYPEIIGNLKALLDGRESADHFTVGVQFVLHQDNAHELRQMGRMCKELGTDYLNIKPVINRGAVGIRTGKFDLDRAKALEDLQWMQDNLNGDGFEVVYKPYQFQINNVPYVEDGALPPDFERNYRRCYAVNFEWWIENDYNISLCGPMGKIVGNLLEQNIEAILESPAYLAELEKINIDSCYRGCRPHYMNEALHALEFPDFKSHVNFVG